MKSNINATPYINNSNVEIYTIDNFLSYDECDRIIKIAPEDYASSGIVGFNDDNKYRTSRTLHYGCSSNVSKDDMKFLKFIENKICNKMKIPNECSERIQITYYNSGESYKFHIDAFDYDDINNMNPKRGSQRSYSFMIYLSDVEEGGATFFPKIK